MSNIIPNNLPMTLKSNPYQFYEKQISKIDIVIKDSDIL